MNKKGIKLHFIYFGVLSCVNWYAKHDMDHA